MIPQINTHVKILLRNNSIVDGIVQEWNNNQIILQSNDNSIIVILHPSQDIILYKIVMNISDKEEIKQDIKKYEPDNNSELEEQFKKTYEKSSEDPLRLKSLAELKILMNKEERQNIANKLRSHYIGDNVKIQYKYPSFIKK